MKTICSHMKKFDARYKATLDKCELFYLQGRFGVRNAPRAQITKIVNDEVRMVER